MEDVDAKFVKLSKVEADGWVDNEVKVVKKVPKKRIQSGGNPHHLCSLQLHKLRAYIHSTHSPIDYAKIC